MKILVVGSGGREHALAWRLARDGHDGDRARRATRASRRSRRCVAGRGRRTSTGQVALAVARGVDLVVVGPEAPLCAGLADRLRAAGVADLRAGRAPARARGLEGRSPSSSSRATASAPRRSAVCADVAEVDARDRRALGGARRRQGRRARRRQGRRRRATTPPRRARRRARCSRRGSATPARPSSIEQRLVGREVSVLALTDGERLEVLPPAEDHKTILDGDRGPNTGGMGTVSPAVDRRRRCSTRVARELLEPTVARPAPPRASTTAACSTPASWSTPTARRGCSSTTAASAIPRPSRSMARARAATSARVLPARPRGELPPGAPRWGAATPRCASSSPPPGYPDDAARRRRDHAASTTPPATTSSSSTPAPRGAASALVTAGGRVLGVTALGDDVDAARARAYAAVDRDRASTARSSAATSGGAPPPEENTMNPVVADPDGLASPTSS